MFLRRRYADALSAVIAGQTQLASGARFIEGCIREAERKSADDPAYWRERAEYYRGRNETAQEEDARLHALALTESNPSSALPRRFLLSDYSSFSLCHDRNPGAVDWLCREIENSSADSDDAKQAASALWERFANDIRGDEGALWTWLANRAKWEFTEERLLFAMLKFFDPAHTVGLDVLAKAGLRDELVAHYRDMQKRMPTSDAPRVAMAALGEM
ncbi:MAG: hypothetical protein HYR85_07865 [Planctomycetes bacterium]|nr:hypothetical protein [Planctomycetota bacterium]MBI3848155.1 hypothetical protein [Planctomycetota bacterium]